MRGETLLAGVGIFGSLLWIPVFGLPHADNEVYERLDDVLEQRDHAGNIAYRHDRDPPLGWAHHPEGSSAHLPLQPEPTGDGSLRFNGTAPSNHSGPANGTAPWDHGHPSATSSALWSDCDTETVRVTKTGAAFPLNTFSSGHGGIHSFTSAVETAASSWSTARASSARPTEIHNVTAPVSRPTRTGTVDPTERTITSIVIATTLTPLITGSGSISFPTATSTVEPTYTVGPVNAPSGSPSVHAMHCGVRGPASGNYDLGTLDWNQVDVPVSLLGCYQFCSDSWGSTYGCKSYEFYEEPGLDVPRCTLYSSVVAYALHSIDNNEPYTWYDLTCGNPAELDQVFRAA